MASNKQQPKSWRRDDPDFEAEPPASQTKVGSRKIRVAYFVSHPIQYQAPLLRRIAQEPDIELTVFFASDFSVQGYQDVGFGTRVQWDVPLLEGYRYEFLPQLRDLKRTGAISQINYGICRRLMGRHGESAYDAVWIHGYSTINAWQFMLCAKALGIPVLLRAESWLESKSRGWVRLTAKKVFFRFLKHFVDGVLPIGIHNTAYWQFYFGDQVPQFLMPYAVDNAYFQDRTREASVLRAELKTQFGMEEGRKVVLFASKLQRRKRCSDLIEAYRRLTLVLEDASQPYLLVIGDGEERRASEAQAAGLSGVRFCGFQNQSALARFLDLADVFVLPSEHEAWGLVVNEAMNAGCALVVSDGVGCQPDLVRHGVEGLVFPTGDIASLASCLRRALDHSGQYGSAARERIREWDFKADVRGLRKALAAVTHRMKA